MCYFSVMIDFTQLSLQTLLNVSVTSNLHYKRRFLIVNFVTNDLVLTHVLGQIPPGSVSGPDPDHSLRDDPDVVQVLAAERRRLGVSQSTPHEIRHLGFLGRAVK